MNKFISDEKEVKQIIDRLREYAEKVTIEDPSSRLDLDHEIRLGYYGII